MFTLSAVGGIIGKPSVQPLSIKPSIASYSLENVSCSPLMFAVPICLLSSLIALANQVIG